MTATKMTLLALALGAGVATLPSAPAAQAPPAERHLRNIRQLTFGGENAEAYFSPDGTRLIFQSTRDGSACDQIYVMDLGSGETKRVSSGEGRTTCGYFFYPE